MPALSCTICKKPVDDDAPYQACDHHFSFDAPERFFYSEGQRRCSRCNILWQPGQCWYEGLLLATGQVWFCGTCEMRRLKWDD